MSYAAGSFRNAVGGRESNLVVPMTDWMPTAHEAPHPSTELSFPAFAHVQNHSKTTRKPRRSSPLAGPALSNDRSVVSLNETAQTPWTRSSLSVSPDADRLLSVRSKSSMGLSRPASIVSVYSPSSSPSPQPYSSRHRPSTAPTPSSKSLQIDMRSIKRPPSTLYFPTEISGHERVSLSPSQGSRGVVSGSSFVSDSSGSRSRASYMSTALAGPSTRPVSVVLEVEAEDEDAGVDDDAAQSRTSTMLHPTSVAPIGNSWYVANEYSETPKFSRLGLAGSNVVMPVSAKERKKQLSRRGSVASFQSNTSTNGAGMSLTRYSSSSSTTSDSKGRNGTIRLSSSINRDTVADVSPQKEHTNFRSHKPEWLKLPQTHIQSRGTSLPSPTPTFSSAASSASSLPLTTPPHSGTSSTPSVVSCATACTSVDESEETTKEDDYYQHPHPKDISPMELEDKLVKRKSVLAMMKSWRGTAPQSAQRNHPFSATGHSPNDSSDEHGVLSVYSESTKNPGVVYIEPLLSSKTNDVKKRNVDVLVTSVPESRSESTIQVIPGNGKRDRRIGSVRKIWNTLTGRTMRI